MNIYIIIAIVFVILSIIVLVFTIGYTNLKKNKEKMDKAEEIIDLNLNKKIDIIMAINNSIKKVTGKKDYLKEYMVVKDAIITNIEKDLKLEEAVRLINELSKDFTAINSDKEFIKNYQALREVDEILVAAKNLFNKNALESNQLLKSFPYSLISKITNFKIRSYYSTINKTDDENF